MPVFYPENIIFIHIPKTGGVSFTEYLSKRNDRVFLNRGEWDMENNITPSGKRKNSEMHYTYENVKSILMIKEDMMDNYRIVSIVRNPYERLISCLFFWELISPHFGPFRVERVIRFFFLSDNYDNTKLPQFDYLCEDGKLVSKIEVIKFENLKNELTKIGFGNFDIYKNKTYNGELDYMKYHNEDSKKLVYEYYKKDFEVFGY